MSTNIFGKIISNLPKYRDYYPKGGGGSIRRWTRLQSDLFKKYMDDEHPVRGPVPLFDFHNPEDAIDVKRANKDRHNGWRFSDDSVIGGFSSATLTMLENKNDLDRFENCETIEQNDTETNMRDNENFVPFVRWKGTIDTRIGERKDGVIKSGYCAIKSPTIPFGGAKLRGKYNALELVVRTDGRFYWLNLTPDTSIPHDLFQTLVHAPPPPEMIGNFKTAATSAHAVSTFPFQRVILPFEQFINSSRGRVRENPRKLDNGVNIYNIGFTIMDGHDGDFVFDLASIRAVNFREGDVLGVDDALAPY